ncbi:hypothetical protein F4818DRAFT_414048 [Hypoxylon cercidicola]|nr:hypothetical protein F4818DRAFT_414048 [Hypoxylon cercidicola]
MAHPRCLSSASPARALHRVLVSGLLSRSTTPSFSSAQHAITYYYLFPPRLFSSSSRVLTPITSSTAAATTVVPHHGVRTLTTTPPLRRIVDPFHSRLTNENIPYNWVRIASPPPESTLSPPQRTDSVLASLDPKKYTLVMVAPPPSPSPSPTEDGSEPTTLAEPRAAICRVIDNAAAAAAEEEERRALRRKAVESKELELSWSIAGHDLAHKLRRLRDFLGRGLRVEVVLAKKRGGRTAGPDQAVAVLAAVRGAVAEVDGAKEPRKMDGDVGGTARLFFEGPGEKKRRMKKQEEEADAA